MIYLKNYFFFQKMHAQKRSIFRTWESIEIFSSAVLKKKKKIFNFPQTLFYNLINYCVSY